MLFLHNVFLKTLNNISSLICDTRLSIFSSAVSICTHQSLTSHREKFGDVKLVCQSYRPEYYLKCFCRQEILPSSFSTLCRFGKVYVVRLVSSGRVIIGCLLDVAILLLSYSCFDRCGMEDVCQTWLSYYYFPSL